ncbi:carboxypeptidase-like regulatory domain-containing protein [Paracidobacterium acidisoli]|uniref:Carboxypeptidase regulatory-like domain-containing protein n=1 Tax=Paracidobacterium acidisoli TaxID=2303751 RepID=A0A372IPI4_9BACT|nr:carboxypeptidase-like regulatory domain-containing protein [Paracidobacterium acidisoli]MBT9331103.1 carboxypeptidase-like regulatory domain-containing protein [Paracidobacterium acidisoli]
MTTGRRSFLRAASLTFTASLLFASAGFAQNFTQKSVQGKVYSSDSKPVTGAIVYLENSSTKDIKTFISTADGSYRFGQISGDSDYTLWAAWKSRKSPSKEISSFDSRKTLIIDLHIKTD